MECFHAEGILELRRQALNMRAMIRPFGSTHLHVAFVRPSTPGEVFFILLNCWITSSGEMGSLRTSPPSAPSVSLGGNSHSGAGFRGGGSAYAAAKLVSISSSPTLQYRGGPSDSSCLTQALGLAL